MALRRDSYWSRDDEEAECLEQSSLFALLIRLACCSAALQLTRRFTRDGRLFTCQDGWDSALLFSKALKPSKKDNGLNICGRFLFFSMGVLPLSSSVMDDCVCRVRLDILSVKLPPQTTHNNSKILYMQVGDKQRLTTSSVG